MSLDFFFFFVIYVFFLVMSKIESFVMSEYENSEQVRLSAVK